MNTSDYSTHSKRYKKYVDYESEEWTALKARRRELDGNRFTPDLPEKPAVLDEPETAGELVPYGATTLRLSVFPDLSICD